MRSDLRNGWRGILAIVATYVHFLIFAQFGFLRLLADRLGADHGLEPAMAAMGLAGLVVSLATGAALRRVEARGILRIGFAGCAASALAALTVHGVAGFALVAAATGATTGLLTVGLAADLRGLLGVRRFGLAVGAGTGLAYLVCNVPLLFAGPAELQAAVAAAGCLVALLLLPQSTAVAGDPPPVEPAGLAGCRPLGFAGIVLIFLALIWIDSAAFATIQQSAELKAQTWAAPGAQLSLGVLHLLAALAAGWLIDRAKLFVLPPLSLGLFTVAFLMLGPQRPFAAWSGPIYVIGISAYSTALVAFPSRYADAPGRVPGRWRAALLYGIAGWLGSALGVGMARETGRIDPALLVAAAVVLAVGWILLDRTRARRLAAVYGPALLIAAAAWPWLLSGARETPIASASAIERGRQVYIDEGCINCHSQYVRPRTEDVLFWGPSAGASLDEQPPLLGNRRQGPDLTNVGNRRSPQWQRLHLRNPRMVSPGSKMPSYAHLFRDGRGDDLVAYLSSLGHETSAQHWALAQSFPRGGIAPHGLSHGRALFARYCTPCHGSSGRGDGPAAGELQPATAIDLLKPQFLLVPADGDGEPDPEALARTIKFGIPGTSMPGHEVFSDEEIAELVAHVRSLRHEMNLAAARDRR